jgi:hypothetical protein
MWGALTLLGGATGSTYLNLTAICGQDCGRRGQDCGQNLIK